MIVQITIMVDVGEQDTTKDGIESARNQIRTMDLEDVIDLAVYTEAEDTKQN